MLLFAPDVRLNHDLRLASFMPALYAHLQQSSTIVGDNAACIQLSRNGNRLASAAPRAGGDVAVQVPPLKRWANSRRALRFAPGSQQRQTQRQTQQQKQQQNAKSNTPPFANRGRKGGPPALQAHSSRARCVRVLVSVPRRWPPEIPKIREPGPPLLRTTQHILIRPLGLTSSARRFVDVA